LKELIKKWCSVCQPNELAVSYWKSEMLIIELFWAGRIVMFPLLAFSIVAIALIVERMVFRVRINRRQRRVVRDVLGCDQNLMFASDPCLACVLSNLKIERKLE
jgi:biopolymer transport protein ExbB/TolQ